MIKSSYDPAIVLDHIRVNLKRNLPEVRPCRAHSHKMSVAGGGPSLEDTKDKLDGYICAINGSLSYLLDNGIKVNACGVVDPHEHVADLIEARPDVHYYIASMAHPKVFEKLKGCHVIMWHASGPEGVDDLVKGLRIGGGGTMGLRWLNIGYVCGFREFHIHGLDSSFKNKTHAYPQPIDSQRIKVDGWETKTAFLNQVSDFSNTMAIMDGANFHLYGDGLLQDKYAALAR